MLSCCLELKGGSFEAAVCLSLPVSRNKGVFVSIDAMTLPVGARAKKGCQRREAANSKPLLPRIPDDITLSLIAPKLSWGDCHRLSSVSHAWRHAIRSRQVHDSRILSQSTESLTLLTYKPSEGSLASVVYSMRENRCYKLPPFPYRNGRMPRPFGIPPTFQCVAVDGKIYVLGGEFVPPAPGEVPSNSGMYVLDLGAGGRQWKQCKSMREPRARFGCGVLGSKIYVLGGLNSKSVICDSEVYDPKEDTWSPIKAMRCLRFDHQVATIGNELVVHGGYIVEPTDYNWEIWIKSHRGFSQFPMPYDPTCLSPEFESWMVAQYDWELIPLVYDEAKEANSLEVYNAIKDEWSVVEGPRGREEGWAWSKAKRNLFFMANGKHHVMDLGEIHVHDTERNSWTHLHSNPLFYSSTTLLDCPSSKLQMILLRNVVAVDDKLLTIVEAVDSKILREELGIDFVERSQACLLQGRGFGRDNEKIIWERTPFAILFEEEHVEFTNYSMHPIQF